MDAYVDVVGSILRKLVKFNLVTANRDKIYRVLQHWARFYAHYLGSRNVCSIFHNHPVQF